MKSSPTFGQRALTLVLTFHCFTSLVSADVLITEVMTSNVATLKDEDGAFPDWIEVHNDGDASVDLNGYSLTDTTDDLNKWAFPAVSLSPGEYLTVFASGKDRTVPGATLHTNFQLKNGGEFLALVDPDKTTILDQFAPEIPQLEDDESYGVRAAGDLWVLAYFSTPTPGAANAGGTVAEEVQFSVSGRTFTDTLEVALSTRSGSRITYTTNGKKPTLFNGTNYSAPITLTETTILTVQISGGPLSQEVFFRITPELAAHTSDLPLVFVESDGVIGTTYDEMLLAIKEPSDDDGRTKLSGDEAFSLTTRGEIRTRGSSTQAFPKKSYRLEFQDESGADRVQKPLGMPAESDWILSGRYEEDRSLVRNEFIYNLSRDIGRYAARTRYCEVYVSRGDGPVGTSDYVGVYSFMEAIKRDADRIDIDELTTEDNAEPEVTGGYIFKVDRSGPNDTVITGGGQTVAITDPASDALTSQQRSYLQGYLNAMAASFDSTDPISGYPAFIDVPSWIDHHLLNMLMLNIDSLRLSTFFYKERNGKVFGGPVWDFNISSGSRDRFGSPPRASNPEVWRGISSDRGTTFFDNGTQRWWGDLFDDQDFQQAYCDRWNELRQGAFGTPYIHALIDSLADEIREAQPRNQARWPEVSPEYGGWQGELDHFKDWLATRAAWVDKELVAPPIVTPNGGSLANGGTVTLKGRRGTLFSPTTVYYTLDGTDPRVVGGGISDTAIAYTSAFSLDASGIITAREYMPDYKPKSDGPDQLWSAPLEISFVVGTELAAAGNLVVSEIMYHPAPVENGNDDDYEFIEFTNIGTAPIDLLGVTANDGITYTQVESMVLAPGASAVIVRNLEAFRERYGDAVMVAGIYTGALANSGDQIGFEGATGEPIISIDYNDNAPWPTEADGDGYSLILNDFANNPDPNLPTSWSVSATIGGNPGKTTNEPSVGITFEEWALTYLPSDIDNGRTGDPDGDGVINLVEFVFASDPVDSRSTDALSVFQEGAATKASYRTWSSIQGVSVVIQTSTDLDTWTDVSLPTVDSASTGGAVIRTATLAAGTAGYLRLKIE